MTGPLISTSASVSTAGIQATLVGTSAYQTSSLVGLTGFCADESVVVEPIRPLIVTLAVEDLQWPRCKSKPSVSTPCRCRALLPVDACQGTDSYAVDA
jgi:hypothetical protein